MRVSPDTYWKHCFPRGNWKSEQNSNVQRHKALLLSAKAAVFGFKLITWPEVSTVWSLARAANNDRLNGGSAVRPPLQIGLYIWSVGVSLTQRHYAWALALLNSHRMWARDRCKWPRTGAFGIGGWGKTVPERVWPLGGDNAMPATCCSASLAPLISRALKKNRRRCLGVESISVLVLRTCFHYFLSTVLLFRYRYILSENPYVKI